MQNTLSPAAEQHIAALHESAARLARVSLTYQYSPATLRRIEEKQNEPRPPSRAWVNGKTVWIQVWRRRRECDSFYGAWYPRTSRYPSTPKRRETINKWKKARAQTQMEMA